MLNNKCKKLRIRQKRYNKYLYCLINRQQITLDMCSKCFKFEPRANKPIINKTNKQKQLEKNRYSIFTNDFTKCYYCHRKKQENEKFDLHEVYGGSNRIRSIKYGLVVPLCRICHSNEEIINELRIQIQKEYEKTHTRDEFIEITGKSYIKGDD